MAAPAGKAPLIRTCILFSKDACSRQQGILCCAKFHTSRVMSVDDTKPRRSLRAQKISSAMEKYLEKAKEHEQFVKESGEEYDLGKRHLANIMGVDPEEFDKEDVQTAIDYLLPSGLHDKKAKPMLKNPSELVPRMQAASFNRAGRPYHYMFYTGKPKYFDFMSEVSGKIERLKEEYKNISENKSERVQELEEKQLDLARSEWIGNWEFFSKFPGEKLGANDHRRFKIIMEHLANQKLAYKENDFIMSMRKDIRIVEDLQIQPLKVEKRSRRKYSRGSGQRKTSGAKARVYANGTGVVDINGEGIDYFEELAHRKAVLFPLSFVDLVEKVDIHCTCWGGGPSGQAGAIRYALCSALKPHVPLEMIEKMKCAGLLSVDVRKRERKKPGKHKARKSHTWKPR